MFIFIQKTNREASLRVLTSIERSENYSKKLGGSNLDISTNKKLLARMCE